MVVDTSAILAIVLDEPERVPYLKAMIAAPMIKLSIATGLEASIVAFSRKGHVGEKAVENLIADLSIQLVPVDRDQFRIACSGFRLYGKGRHPAGLNYGDLFAYALSKVSGEPLLFKGDDFSKTDVVAAL